MEMELSRAESQGAKTDPVGGSEEALEDLDEIERQLTEQLEELAASLAPAQPVLDEGHDTTLVSSWLEQSAGRQVGAGYSGELGPSEEELLKLLCGEPAPSEAPAQTLRRSIDGRGAKTLLQQRDGAGRGAIYKRAWIRRDSRDDAADAEYARWVQSQLGSALCCSPRTSSHARGSESDETSGWRSFVHTSARSKTGQPTVQQALSAVDDASSQPEGISPDEATERVRELLGPGFDGNIQELVQATRMLCVSIRNEFTASSRTTTEDVNILQLALSVLHRCSEAPSSSGFAGLAAASLELGRTVLLSLQTSGPPKLEDDAEAKALVASTTMDMVSATLSSMVLFPELALQKEGCRLLMVAHLQALYVHEADNSGVLNAIHRALDGASTLPISKEGRTDALHAALEALNAVVEGRTSSQEQLHRDFPHVLSLVLNIATEALATSPSHKSTWGGVGGEPAENLAVKATAMKVLGSACFRCESIQVDLINLHVAERVKAELEALIEGDKRKEKRTHAGVANFDVLLMVAETVRFVRYLALHAENRLALAQAQAEITLTDALRWLGSLRIPAHNLTIESTRVNTMIALSNATYDVHESKTRAVRAGALRVISHAMLTSKQSLIVQHSGARALRNICDVLDANAIQDSSDDAPASCELVVQALTAAVKNQLDDPDFDDAERDHDAIQLSTSGQEAVRPTDVHEHALAAFRNYIYAKRKVALSHPLMAARAHKSERGRRSRRQISQLKALQNAVSFGEAVTIQRCAHLALDSRELCSSATREQAENLLAEVEPYLRGTGQQRRSGTLARVTSMPKVLRKMVRKANSKMRGSRSYNACGDASLPNMTVTPDREPQRRKSREDSEIHESNLN